MRCSLLLMFVQPVPKFPSRPSRSISLGRPPLTVRSPCWRRLRSGDLCMSSERSGELPPMCQNRSYGTSDVVPTQSSSPTASTDVPATDSSVSRSATGTNSKLVAAFLFLAISLISGSAAAAAGVLNTDTLVQIARWFERLGPNAIYLYSVLYFLLELVAVPALPLTLGSGYLFGLLDGTIAVSIASTFAATASFLIARYVFRASISRLANGNTRFRVIDRAIGREGFKFVLLLRLSPLLPFAISNYLYGLTSVKLRDYIMGSWLGMLPGTIAYVSAGAAVNTLTDLHEGQSAVSPGLVITGLVATIAALASIGNIAREAIENVDEEEIP